MATLKPGENIKKSFETTQMATTAAIFIFLNVQVGPVLGELVQKHFDFVSSVEEEATGVVRGVAVRSAEVKANAFFNQSPH